MYNLTTGVRIAIVNASDWMDKTPHLYCPANNIKRDEFGKPIEDNTCIRKPRDVKINTYRHGHSKTMTGRPQLGNDFGTMGGDMGLMSPTDAGFSVLDMHDQQIRGGAQSTTH